MIAGFLAAETAPCSTKGRPPKGTALLHLRNNPAAWWLTGSTQRRETPTDGQPNDRSRSVLRASYRAGDRLRHW